ncbi:MULTISPECIES: hypothetical protein [unclassified Streptomyces]|nr:hypothetical protein [Streptomyces sp. JV190]MEE1841009.1 hypothetical protein [Streptomyces sp. JV190]
MSLRVSGVRAEEGGRYRVAGEELTSDQLICDEPIDRYDAARR